MAADDVAEVGATAYAILARVREQAAAGGPAESVLALGLLDDHEMTRVSVPEPAGAGAPLVFLNAILEATGRAAVSVPLLDTHSGATLLQAAGAAPDDGLPNRGAAFAVDFDDQLLDVSAPPSRRLTFTHADSAATLVSVVRTDTPDSAQVRAWRIGDMSLDMTTNVAGEVVGSCASGAVPIAEISAEIPVAVARGLALTDLLGRSSMIVGAARSALDQTLTYVGDREQFGRPLARFQSVQHTVSLMASHVVAAAVAVEAATQALGVRLAEDPQSVSADDLVAALSCRIQCSRTAAYVSRAAHQLHGAIGFTDEHSLRHATTRLQAWRSHGLTHLDASRALGRVAFSQRDLWPLVTGGGGAPWPA